MPVRSAAARIIAKDRRENREKRAVKFGKAERILNENEFLSKRSLRTEKQNLGIIHEMSRATSKIVEKSFMEEE